MRSMTSSIHYVVRVIAVPYSPRGYHWRSYETQYPTQWRTPHGVNTEKSSWSYWTATLYHLEVSICICTRLLHCSCQPHVNICDEGNMNGGRVRCKSAACLGTVHCITAICHIITNHSFVVLRLIPIPLPHNRFDFLLLILARAHQSVRTVLGRYTAPRGVFWHLNNC